MTPDQIKPGHTYEMDDEFSRTVVSTHGEELTYRDCYGVAESDLAEFASACVCDVTPAPESDQVEKVAQAQNAGASRGDGCEPLGRLKAIAAEMIRCDGLPDPDKGDFRPLGKMAVRSMRRSSVRTGNAIAAAVAEIRKQQKAAPSAAAVNAELLEAARAVASQIDYLQGLWGREAITQRLVDQMEAAIARAEANQ